jgi:hypothetical protein
VDLRKSIRAALQNLLPVGALGASFALAATAGAAVNATTQAPADSVATRLQAIRREVSALTAPEPEQHQGAGVSIDDEDATASPSWWGNGGFGRWRFGWGNGGPWWHNGWGNGWHNWGNAANWGNGPAWSNAGWPNGGWHNFWHNG